MNNLLTPKQYKQLKVLEKKSSFDFAQISYSPVQMDFVSGFEVLILLNFRIYLSIFSLNEI